MNQIEFSFDRETLRKIAKGFIHSLIVTVGLLALDFIMKSAGLVHFENPFIAGAYMYFIQNAYNIAREYISGEEED